MPPKPKMPLGKVVLINFGIMLAYMGLLSILAANGRDASMEVLIGDMMLVMAQVGLNMLIGLILVFTDRHKQLGGAMLISGIIMGVVGFGSCLAHVTMFES